MTFTLVAITVLSLVLAAISTTVAWRVVRDDRRRSEARVAALASELRDDPDDPIGAFSEEELAPTMFAGAEPSSSSRVAILAGAALVVIAIAAAVAGGLVARTGDVTDTAKDARDLAPLELINLAHEQDRDRLTVHGVVRGPWIEAPFPLAAVVTVYRGDGSVITTERTMVAPVVAPHRETTFHVTVSGALDAARFKVSFADANRVVPHVDRRS
jgi:hypothetical protein